MTLSPTSAAARARCSCALGKAAPAAKLIGIDPDPTRPSQGQGGGRRDRASPRLCTGCGRAAGGKGRDQNCLEPRVPSSADGRKGERLAAMHESLGPRGELHIADYGLQRTSLMRTLFRLTIQNLDGRANTEPNARGILPDLMRRAGFEHVEETIVIPTVTGTVSLYRALRWPISSPRQINVSRYAPRRNAITTSGTRRTKVDVRLVAELDHGRSTLLVSPLRYITRLSGSNLRPWNFAAKRPPRSMTWVTTPCICWPPPTGSKR